MNRKTKKEPCKDSEGYSEGQGCVEGQEEMMGYGRVVLRYSSIDWQSNCSAEHLDYANVTRSKMNITRSRELHAFSMIHDWYILPFSIDLSHLRQA